MAKQLNVNLAFTADTSQAKASLQQLQTELTKLTSAKNLSNSQLPITKEIQQATTAAMELQTHLKNATNVETGKLDLTKLNNYIKQSGTSLAEYGRKLQQLGPTGQQAFMSLASAVSQAEIPIRRSNTALTNMMVTLKNTARWQLSSTMLHAFMGSIRSAYNYAQDLNESLNKIRIVTGQNIDQMSKFAEQANKAARALSTTTTAYTDAALIYYQQGLDDKAVMERTDVTIKMANAAGQSAQTVSDQMTAVWNNFDDGSKSLEYYADVMTALGATTASSTAEIAQGLEKFAAVAETVGLSYEYATAALATVTANTRQSADVVGTAFKTLFARIQDLELGETLDDGTTLGSYSQALEKVGINIKDTNGQMKEMDVILEEMASKWETLGKAEQVALPRPNYFAALLWNRLMGEECYKFDAPQTEGAHVYCHNAKDGKGKYCYLIINNSLTEETIINVPKDSHIYTLTGKDGMRSKTMCLNKRPLVLYDDNSLPILDGRHVDDGSFFLPAGSCTFVVV